MNLLIPLSLELLWCTTCGTLCTLLIILNQLGSIIRDLGISCNISFFGSSGLTQLKSLRHLTNSIIQRNRFLEEQLCKRFSLGKPEVLLNHSLERDKTNDNRVNHLSSTSIFRNTINQVLGRTLACGTGVVDLESLKTLQASDLPEPALSAILEQLRHRIKTDINEGYSINEAKPPTDLIIQHYPNREIELPLTFYGINLIKYILITWTQNSKKYDAILWSAYRHTQMPTSIDNDLLKSICVETQQQLKNLEIYTRLDQEKQIAQKIGEERLNFISHLSHDIRTPLANIQNIFYLLLPQRSGDNEALRSNFKGLLELGINNCIRLNSMISDILDFTKHQAGRLRALPVKIDLKALFFELINENSLRAEEQGIKFVIEQDIATNWDLLQNESFNKWKEVFVDARHIRRILLNLITNIINHCPKAEVRVRPIPFNETHLVLTIQDNGPGITPEKLKTIFEPYGESRSGYGLGLALTKVLCELNSIELQIESTPGKGTIVTLKLPLNRPIDQPI